HAFHRQQVLGRLLRGELLLGGQRLVEQRVAGAGAQFLDDVLVEALDRQQLAHRNVGDLLDGAEALRDQDAGDLLVDLELLLEQLARGGLLGLALGLDLLGGHHVELPAGHAAGQAHVLPALADRLRQAVLGHGQVHGVLVLVDDDRLHFRRRHRVDDELGGIVGPQHDVHALAVELVGHRLHARTAHADAGAARVGAVVVGEHRDLGPVTRITRAGHARDQALPDLRRLALEQPPHAARRGTADEQLRPTRLGAHVVEVAADPVAGAQHVAGDALVLGDNRLGVATQVDVDVAALHALDDAGDQLADAVLPGVDHLL